MRGKSASSARRRDEAFLLYMAKKEKKEKIYGCDNCHNTGLEPGVSRDVAQVCPVCNGSPFEPRDNGEASGDEE